MIISNDPALFRNLEILSNDLGCDLKKYDTSTDPLDVISEIASKISNILILDDDFLSPNSAKLLESIKKVSPNLPIIFLTSDTSLELGRKINSIGVKYYLIKPVSESNLREFVKSVKNENEEHIN